MIDLTPDISFVIRGVPPQPWPKEQAGTAASGRNFSYYRDPKGLIKNWMETVRLGAVTAMVNMGWDLEPPGVAVLLGVSLWIPRPKSNKTDLHVQRPDYSNFKYLVENVLQAVTYHEDCQVLGPLPGGKFWAGKTNKPGVMITLKRVDADWLEKHEPKQDDADCIVEY